MAVDYKCLKSATFVISLLVVLGVSCPLNYSYSQLLEVPFRLSNLNLILPQPSFLQSSCTKQLTRAVLKKSLFGTSRIIRDYKHFTSLSKLDQERNAVAVLTSNDNVTRELIKFIDVGNIGVKKKVLILLENVSDIMIRSVLERIRVDQQIYFVNTKSLVMREGYQVGGQVVENDIGQYDIVDGMLMFNHTAKMFIDRRADFHGQHIKGMTDEWVLLLELKKGYENQAMFFEGNQTYEVTNYAYGLYFDIFKTLSKELNFTFSLYKRKDGMWGAQEGNKLIGMVANLVDGSADVIVQALGYNLWRSKYVWHTPFMTKDYYSIFIQRQVKETINWETYLVPFHWSLWITMTILAVGVGTWLFMMSRDQTYGPVASYIGHLWSAFIVYFGGKTHNGDGNYAESKKLILLSSAIGGVVIWMGYRASMTSQLSVRRYVDPFNDFESLLETDFM